MDRRDPAPKPPACGQDLGQCLERVRVAMLHDARDEGRYVVWSLSLASLSGEVLDVDRLHVPVEQATPLEAAEEHLRRGGIAVDGSWLASPDGFPPRYYASVLFDPRTN